MHLSFFCWFLIHYVCFLRSVESIGRTQILEELYCGEENCYDILGESMIALKLIYRFFLTLGLLPNATDTLIRKTVC
jgi:hypothetical protein